MRIRRELKTAAKENLFANFQNILIFMLLIGALIIAATLVLRIFVLFLMPAFMMSTTIFFLAMARGKKIKLEMIFSGFHDYWRVLMANLVMGVAIFIASLFFAIPGIILGFAWSQTFFILADDKKIGVFDAMRQSYVMMKGHKFDYWVLGLSFMGWIILVCLTFGLGAILLTPYMQLTFAEFYLDLQAHNQEVGTGKVTGEATTNAKKLRAKKSKKQ